MPSLLEQLENNEAVLLMYIAGELPEEDRVEVEQMLQTDARLRADLNDLRGAMEGHEAMMIAADTTTRLPVKEDAAVRNTLRAMRQWQLLHPYGVEETKSQRKTLTYAWWLYPSASAAMVVLAAVVWWGFKPDALPGTVVDNSPWNSNNSTTFVEATPDQAVVPRDAYVFADPLDGAYLELRSIQELSEGM